MFATPGEAWKKLNELKRDIEYFFSPFRTGGSRAFYDSQVNTGFNPGRSATPTFGRNPWLKSFVKRFEVPSEIKLLCDNARMAEREHSLDRQEKLSDCFQSTNKLCERSIVHDVACHLPARAVEFESRWQQLSEVCSATETLNNSTVDVCQETALTLCDFQLISPEDEWIGQIISMRDFACATAGKLSEPQLYCFTYASGFHLCDQKLARRLEREMTIEVFE